MRRRSVVVSTLGITQTIVLNCPLAVVIPTSKEPLRCGDTWNVGIAMPISTSRHCAVQPFYSLSE